MLSILLAASSVQLSNAQDQTDTKLAGAAAVISQFDKLGSVAALSTPVGSVQPVAPALGELSANVSRVPDKSISSTGDSSISAKTPGFFANMWKIVKDRCTQNCQRLCDRFNEKPGRNRLVAGAVCAGATYWLMQKYKHSWMYRIEQRVNQPYVSLSPLSTDLQKNFNWATWRTNLRTSSGGGVYNTPTKIGLNQEQLLNHMIDDIEASRAFVFKPGIYKTIVSASEIRNNGALEIKGLKLLREAIQFEQGALRKDLMRLSAELQIDTNSDADPDAEPASGQEINIGLRGINISKITNQASNCFAYLKNIFSSNRNNTQSKMETALYRLLNQHNSIGAAAGNTGDGNTVTAPTFNRLGDLYQLTQDHVNNRRNFINQFNWFLYSQRAAGLYFDVAKAYGRLEAMVKVISEQIRTLEQAQAQAQA